MKNPCQHVTIGLQIGLTKLWSYNNPDITLVYDIQNS